MTAGADQAAGLRSLIAARDARVLVVTGAEARSYAPLALELAAACESEGRRVLLLDLTRGALAQHLGQPMRYELMHVIDAHKRLEEVVVAGPRELPLLPAARGVRALANAWRGRPRFVDFIERAGGAPQLVLVAAPAEELATLAALAEFAALVVVGPESCADLKPCYAALKRAHAAAAAAPRLLYAGGIDADAASRVHARLMQTACAFLGGEPALVGRLAAGPACGHGKSEVARMFPSLGIAQLSSALSSWSLPPLAAGSTPATARARIATRGANAASL